jgi:N-acetylglucosamine malate deacetylase 1
MIKTRKSRTDKIKALILSPHTDDAELGCGGSIAKFLDTGHNIYWVVFSSAEESLPKNLPKDTLKREFLNVIKSFKMKDNNYRLFDFKVRSLTNYRQNVLDELVKIQKKFQPEIVIGPSLNDFHQDHLVVANEMVRAFKTSSSIICYELPWNHVSFNTQLFVKLEKKYIDKKLQILKNYKSQIMLHKRYFSDDLIVGWAKMRGTQIKEDFAEAFEVVRWIM